MRIFPAVTAAVLFACFVAAPAAPAAPAGKPALKLERIVLVMRHGVRSPTASPEALSKLTPQPWPAWPVAPGILTDHGRDDVARMGAWLRASYARKGLWPAKGCLAPGAVAAWADGGDQRTRVSGQTTLDAAFPGCGLSAPHGPDGGGDSFFSATAQGACPIDADKAREAVMAQAHGDLDAGDPRLGAAKAAMTRVVIGDAPCTDEKACVMAGPSRLKAADDGIKISGPLGTGATFAENLLLEYAQGMPAGEVGWGRANAVAIARVMPIHDLEADLERRTPYLAAHNGALMMRAVLAALQGRPALPQGHGSGAKLTLIAGHDTNISNLSGIIGADWTLPGQPDKTPPDAALAFEVWRDAAGARFVRVAVIYQTLEDLRSGAALTPAHPAGRVEAPVPGCADGPGGECRLETFVSLISPRLPAECAAKP